MTPYIFLTQDVKDLICQEMRKLSDNESTFVALRSAFEEIPHEDKLKDVVDFLEAVGRLEGGLWEFATQLMVSANLSSERRDARIDRGSDGF